MPLSPGDVAALGRLVDEAGALPAEALEAWLAALPAGQRHLVPHVRRVLSALAATDDVSEMAASLPPWQRLPGIAPDVPEPGAGDRIGPYRLVQLIGRGGMGTVWRAERADGIFERDVALKLPDLAKSPRLAERMARERSIGARLEHPNIARLYDAGIDDAGRPYLVMEHVQGRTLLEHCNQRALSHDERIGLVLQACNAVAHAHRQLVVHRDIKPSNLLVDETGTLKLLDFGISRWLAGDSDETVAGTSELRGTHTPGYAAPEQRDGAAVSTATDIYSLGAVAHVLLLGHLPVPAGTLAASQRKQLGPELAAVLEHALHSVPAERYASADALADDLRCVLQNRPVRAAAAPWHRRCALFVRRRRVPVAVAAAVIGVLAVVLTLLLREQSREREQAERVAQVREFLLEILEDAEPLESQTGAPITGAQWVEGALQRARESFPGQDALRGGLLGHLGFMFRRFRQPERALAVLNEAHGLLEASATAGDPTLHIVRGQLALQLLHSDRSDLPRAEALAQAALAGCGADSVRCAKARAYAHAVLREATRRRGDVALGLQHARQASVESERAFGTNHPETAMSRLNLATAQRNSGELMAAAQTLARAQAVAAGTRLRAADRIQLDLWTAILAADLGQHEAAIDGMRKLLAQPPAQAEWPALHRLLAQSLHAEGRWTLALTSADAAIAAAKQAGLERQEMFARLARARTLSMLDRHGEAGDEVAQALAALDALRIGERAVERLRARRVAGEVALRAGDATQAREWLETLPGQHRAAGTSAPTAPVDLAQALDLLGALERRAGRSDLALAHHRQAASLLAAALPEAHPLRLRNAVDAALAGGADLRAAVQRYLEALPADSAWHVLLAPLPANPSAGILLVL